MIEILWVGLGGFLGAVLRHTMSTWVANSKLSSFPWGTLAVNGVGCLAIGLLMSFLERGWVGPQTRLFVGVGLLGALTTFSTFSWETLQLLRSGSMGLAFTNVLGNVVLSLAAVALGFLLGRAF